MRNLLAYILLGALLYYLATSNSLAATPQQRPVVGAGCVETYQAQYAPHWAEMNVLQRAMVGLAAAGCAEGGR